MGYSRPSANEANRGGWRKRHLSTTRTLFNAISGLVPYRGEIRWQGASLGGRSAAAIARGGIVQCPETRELFGDLTVQENLDLGGQRLAQGQHEH